MKRPENHTLLDGQESVGELMALLGHSSLRARRAGVAALASRDPAETLPGLLAALADDSDAAARGSAGDVLLRYGKTIVSSLTRALAPDTHRDRTIQILTLLDRLPTQETMEAVLPLAAHEDPSVAAAAITCLGSLRDPSAVPVLLTVLDEGKRWQSFYAIDALGEIGHAAAVNRLVPLLADGYYRKAVLRALGKIGDGSAIAPMVRALRENHPCPDRTALAALNEMVDRARTGAGREALEAGIRQAMGAVPDETLISGLVEVLRGQEQEARRQAARGLGWTAAETAIRPLVEALAESALADTAARSLRGLLPGAALVILGAAHEIPLPSTALSRLVEMLRSVEGLPVDDFMATALRHEDVDVRQAAAAAMAERARMEHLELLVEVLSDEAPVVSGEAVRGLLRLASQSDDDRHQVAGRIDGLAAAAAPSLRCAALRVINRLGCEGAHEALDLALRDPVAEVRRTAVSVLGEAADPDRLWRLAGALADEDARVREEAVTAISRLTDERARGVLLASLHDRSLWVRCRAARALASHPAVEVEAALEEAARNEVLPVRVSAVEALTLLRPGSDAILAAMARDGEAEVRRAALRGLQGSRPAPLADLLTALEDQAWSVRSAAAEALGSGAHAAAFGPLSRCLDREDDALVRRAILRALFAVDPEAALPALIGALSETKVAEAAVALLVEGQSIFADDLRAEWAAGMDPGTREGLARVLEEIGRQENLATDGEYMA